MAVTNLGRVGLVLKGDWSSATTYVKLDVVAYDGNSWVAKRSNTNVTPNTTNSDDWQLISNNADLVSTVQGYKNDAEAAAEAAAESAASVPDALANEATDFSTSVSYTAGQYVIYDNGTHSYLYRFTADHAAGEWIGTDATQVTLGDDVASLKSAIDQDAIDNLLQVENIFGTTQSIVFDSAGNVQSITHKDGNNNTVRADVFTFAANSITETRTLSTGKSLTIVTNLTTLETTVTYAAA